jgi:uncharacterized YigZ family protein
MVTSYESIVSPARATLKIVGSRFIASAFPISSEAEAAKYLDDVRREFFDATHNCHAFVLDPDGRRQRSSDAGEPSGTAGAKILSAIHAASLSDVEVVVTRYFGGTKLGIGGLGRAYYDAAHLVLENVVHCTRQAMKSLVVHFPYDATSAVMNILNKHKAVTTATDYMEAISLHALLPLSQQDVALYQLTEATSGAATVEAAEGIVWHTVDHS